MQRSFRTQGGTGRGIGTSSVKLLTEQYLRGTVSFASEPRRGTTFAVTLPAVSRSSGAIAALPQTFRERASLAHGPLFRAGAELSAAQLVTKNRPAEEKLQPALAGTRRNEVGSEVQA